MSNPSRTIATVIPDGSASASAAARAPGRGGNSTTAPHDIRLGETEGTHR
jgi:hypothetical protein